MDATPVFGEMQDYLSRPALVDGSWCGNRWARARIRACSPSGSEFQATGGTRCWRATWAAPWSRSPPSRPEYRVIEAPARVFLPACGGGGLQGR